MRIVADTNTLVSGSLWNGPPARLLDAVKAGQLALVQSPLLWVEFVEVLSRPKFAIRLRLLGVTPTMLADGLRQYVTWIADSEIPLPPELRDPKDLIVLAAAVAARVDAVVTGDDDLLWPLSVVLGVPVWSSGPSRPPTGSIFAFRCPKPGPRQAPQLGTGGPNLPVARPWEWYRRWIIIGTTWDHRPGGSGRALQGGYQSSEASYIALVASTPPRGSGTPVPGPEERITSPN